MRNYGSKKFYTNDANDGVKSLILRKEKTLVYKDLWLGHRGYNTQGQYTTLHVEVMKEEISYRDDKDSYTFLELPKDSLEAYSPILYAYVRTTTFIYS